MNEPTKPTADESHECKLRQVLNMHRVGCVACEKNKAIREFEAKPSTVILTWAQLAEKKRKAGSK